MAGWTSTTSTGCRSTSSFPSGPRSRASCARRGSESEAAEVAALQEAVGGGVGRKPARPDAAQGDHGAARRRRRAARGAGRRARRARATRSRSGQRSTRERAAVEALTDAARGLLSSEGEELSDDDRRAGRRHAACRRARRRGARAGPRGAARARASPRRTRRTGSAGADAPRGRRRRPRPGGDEEEGRARAEDKKQAAEQERGAARTGQGARRGAQRGPRNRARGSPARRAGRARREGGARAPRQGRGGAARRRRAELEAAQDGAGRGAGAAARRRGGRPRGEPVAQRRTRDHDQHDHEQHEHRAADRHRTLAPPELGVGAIAGVVALGRSADPVIVVVVGAHEPRLECEGMNYRTLGRTGVKVSPLCLGAMMFGAWGNPDHDECDQDHPPRARRRDQLHRHRRRLPPRRVGGDRRQGARRRQARQRRARHQGPRDDGRRPQRVRQHPPLDHPRGRELAAATGHGLDRPVPDPPPRGRHRHRRNARRADRPGPRRKGPVHRLLDISRRARSSRPSGWRSGAGASGSCASSRRIRSWCAASRTTCYRPASVTAWA